MIKKVLIILVLIISLISCNNKTDINLSIDKDGYVKFEDAIKSKQFVIVKFGLEICTGCIEANEILIGLMPEYKDNKNICFSKVDLFEDRGAEKKYNIKMMPTIIFFDKNGKEFHRIEGIITKEAIKEKIDSICLDF